MLTPSGKQRITAFRAPVNVTPLAQRAGIAGHVLMTSDVADYLEAVDQGVWHALYALAEAIPYARGESMDFSFAVYVPGGLHVVRLKASRTTARSWFLSHSDA